MARKKVLPDTTIVSLRVECEMISMLNDIAALESLSTGRKVTTQELIRNALHYVYDDNERLRECFRRCRRMLRSKNY